MAYTHEIFCKELLVISDIFAQLYTILHDLHNFEQQKTPIKSGFSRGDDRI